MHLERDIRQNNHKNCPPPPKKKKKTSNLIEDIEEIFQNKYS